MKKFSFKIAFTIITAGLFVVVSFAALNYENLTSAFYTVAGALIAFIFLFGFAMGRSYSLPVRELLQRADDVSKGNLKSKVSVKTKDEIEELSKTFNKIAEGLAKNKSDLETLKESSDIKFKTKALLSDQVITALEQKIQNRSTELQRALENSERLQIQVAARDKEIAELKGQIEKKKSKRVKSKEQMF